MQQKECPAPLFGRQPHSLIWAASLISDFFFLFLFSYFFFLIFFLSFWAPTTSLCLEIVIKYNQQVVESGWEGDVHNLCHKVRGGLIEALTISLELFGHWGRVGIHTGLSVILNEEGDDDSTTEGWNTPKALLDTSTIWVTIVWRAVCQMHREEAGFQSLSWSLTQCRGLGWVDL